MSKPILMIEGLDVMEGTGGFSEPPRYILYEIEEDVGDESDVGIPGNIPNPEVKRVNADGTWRATSWESRKSPTSSFLFIRSYVCDQFLSLKKKKFMKPDGAWAE